MDESEDEHDTEEDVWVYSDADPHGADKVFAPESPTGSDQSPGQAPGQASDQEDAAGAGMFKAGNVNADDAADNVGSGPDEVVVIPVPRLKTEKLKSPKKRKSERSQL